MKEWCEACRKLEEDITKQRGKDWNNLETIFCRRPDEITIMAGRRGMPAPDKDDITQEDKLDFSLLDRVWGVFPSRRGELPAPVISGNKEEDDDDDDDMDALVEGSVPMSKRL